MTEPNDLACPRCGSAVTPEQEYCVECGMRLAPAAGVRTTVTSAWGRRAPWYPAEWVWPTLVALVVALLAAAAVVAAQESRETGQEPFIATNPPAAEPAPPAEEPAATEPTVPTLGEEEPLEEEPPAEEEPPIEEPPPPPDQIVQWPEGTNGFTVVLASLPESGGRPPAVARAREAATSGLPDAGVLRSANYSSLRPGYFVVFSGVYGSRGDAESAVSAARGAGFDTAYVGEIAR